VWANQFGVTMSLLCKVHFSFQTYAAANKATTAQGNLMAWLNASSLVVVFKETSTFVRNQLYVTASHQHKQK
jgi:hypothetical protein